MATSRPSTPQSVESAVRLASAQLGEKSPPPGAEKKPGSAIDKFTPPATAAKTWILLSSVFMAMFLVALDRTIISTAIPAITNDFDSLQDVGWYGSSYLLTCCAFQLLFGKLYAFFSVKAVFLWSILVFEVASAVCGAAPNSVAFIVGRAISGIGAAGIFAGTIVCIVHTIPLQHRPRIQGLFGALFGIASVIGPLIGGAFTTNVTWRWCFYINLPIGAVAAVVIFFWLQMPERDTAKQPLKQKLAQLDALGTFFLVPGVVCLLLALQWGGQTYSWSNWRIILLLCLAGVLLLAFGAVQVFFPKTATLPPHIFKQRSVCSAFWSTLCIGSGNYIFVYFLPIWFQSIQGASAVDSGIHLLPLMLSMVVGSLAGGFTTPKIGYYTPYAIIGSCIMAVGAGLITTFHVDTSEGMWIGYQVVYGLGLGLCFQVPNLAVQTVMPKPEVPIGLALMLFGQLLGAAVFIAVGENVLGNQLVARLAGIPGIDERLVTTSGATSLLASVAENLRPVVLMAYNKALQKVFEVGLVISCLTVLGTATLEWRSISKKPEPKAGGESGAPAADGKRQKKGFEEAIKEQAEETRKS